MRDPGIEDPIKGFLIRTWINVSERDTRKWNY